MEPANDQYWTKDEFAVNEHLAAWARLNQRADRGSRERFLAVMAKVPDAEPEPHDRI